LHEFLLLNDSESGSRIELQEESQDPVPGQMAAGYSMVFRNASPSADFFFPFIENDRGPIRRRAKLW
jgi:hypothetical protein